MKRIAYVEENADNRLLVRAIERLDQRGLRFDVNYTSPQREKR